jgi:hypothetical protein
MGRLRISAGASPQRRSTVSYMLLRLRSRTGLTYAFSTPASSMSPASMAGLRRGLPGYFGFMRQLLVCLWWFIGAVVGDVDFPVVAAFKAIGPLRSEVPIPQAATIACHLVPDVDAA